MRRTVSFGIKTSQMGNSYREIQAIWREADQLPAFEHAWLWDHMVPLRGDVAADALEAWTLLAALAAQTERLRLGVIVTSNRLRSPTLLAKMAATVDVIADGRLDFGIGTGGSRLPAEDPTVRAFGTNPAEREFEAYGVPLVSPGQAVRDLAESCAIIRRMWTEAEPFDHDGPVIRLKGAVCAPRPMQKPHPPILIGGSGDQVLRIVAEHADIWNYPGLPSERFRQRDDVLRSHCAEIGRDPDEIIRSMQTIIRCDDPAAPAQARAQLLEMIDAGVTHIVLAALLGGRPVSWLVEHIIDPVLAGTQTG
ncbi:LLM class flavin-dependent oxidoreductase [Frankia sp. AiPa1]|uniref:LLM class flavin-dependent oxidoreductase n=1 Tax=Frankia sp. AiPa1 TaxID=573492 RepID=UPI00202B9E0C|nr:LLM class flavin-dependent oxidoreductase [Frankia sp. AiPa1]MCL9759851.1 LLM class flavin-dependent oxidoreductase [Frankia sp. AiPa1]